MNSVFRVFFLLLSISLHVNAQEQPIGYWRAHLPFNNAVSAATDGVTIFTGSSESFFTYNAAEDEISTYSKVDGMADVGLSYIGYDPVSEYAIIAYSNGNIDLFKDETFYNLPDIKLKNISPKRINHIYTDNGMAYLSTSFGIVVLNLVKRETKETYSFITGGQTIEIREFTAAGNYFYAVTAAGLFRANRNHANLQAFSAWQKIDTRTSLRSVTSVGSQVFLSNADTLFQLSADTLKAIYESPYEITRLDMTPTRVYINEFIVQSYTGRVKILDPATLVVVDSFRTLGKAINTVLLSDNSIWCADFFNGLGKRNEANELSFVKPEGPSSVGSFDILPYNGEIWVAHGGYDENWTYLYNRNGLSNFKDGKWKVYRNNNYPPLQDNDITDFIALAKDPVTGDLYAASYRQGLFVLKAEGGYEWYKDGSPYTDPHFIDQGTHRASGLAYDGNGNLWITSFGGVRELAVKMRDGSAYKFTGGGTVSSAAYVLVDDNDVKWYALPAGVDGVAAYFDNYTPGTPSDDIYAKISASKYGLNSNINCIAKDKENAIWVGTNDGIGVLTCSVDQIQTGTCEIRKPIVQFDQFAGYLFQNEKVRTIAVDGANRKWVGTTNGVWLISPDGDQIIYRFTAENSPLPSNTVQKIAIDPVTGDVYVGTSAGLVSYRSTATEGQQVNQTVVTFPNPVPSGYSGTIAIRGLTENADVRITDITGQLVYRSKALGGQAVWNGLDYTGRRPQSGVYLIFVTNKDGSQTHAGKMVFME